MTTNAQEESALFDENTYDGAARVWMIQKLDRLPDGAFLMLGGNTRSVLASVEGNPPPTWH